jgi:DNA integrity scanning protein DisA with diadenylate cyclase activity
LTEAGSDEATASAVMSFVERLEDSSAKFYREMAERHPENGEAFLRFAKESEKNKTLIIRTYQETITDALEACFSFKGLKLGDYEAETVLLEKNNIFDDIKIALKLEERANAFYLDVEERSAQLLATIPRAFKKAVETRTRRVSELKEILKASAGS